MATSIESVLFDLDNTLVNRVEAFERLCRSFWAGEPVLHSQVGFEAAYARLVEWDEDGGKFPKREVFENAQAEWGELSRSPVELEQWYEDVYPSFFVPDPLVLSFINALNYNERKWGIVTNGPAYQSDVVKATGLQQGNAGVVISSVLGVSKPEPKIFEEGMRVIGHTAGPTSCLFVGDNPVADIGGAHAIGMLTAWVKRGRVWSETAYAPDFMVDHVDELRTVLSL